MSNGIHTKEQAKALLASLIERGSKLSADDSDDVESWFREACLRVDQLFPNTHDAATFRLTSLRPLWDKEFRSNSDENRARRESRAHGMAKALKQLGHLLAQDVEIFWKEPAKPRLTRPPALDVVLQICDRFPPAAAQLSVRRAPRKPIEINDEHDVQYVLGALLAVPFDDIRREEPGPSVAGSSTRVEFFLKRERLLIECKMTRKGLGQKELGEELLLDIRHYEVRGECGALVIFIYDPTHKILNRPGLIDDLEGTGSKLAVRVVIRP